MLDFFFVAAFALLLIATWWVTRSVSWTAIRLVIAFGIAGNAVQTAMAWGMEWNVRVLQWLSLLLMCAILVWGFLRTSNSGARTARRQFAAVVAPAVLIGIFLVAMRYLAPDTAGPLSAVGYLINHPLAEDNAKWLHLTSQLATGQSIEFNGYAGGPLLLLMSIMAALISVLSMLMLGGVNEVAVAANTMVGVQFLLIALTPFALAPFAEGKFRGRRPDHSPVKVPVPLIWTGVLVLFTASAVVTSYGHLSLQFVLIVLALWAAIFLVPGRDGYGRILMTLAIVTTASVWVPLNLIGIALIAILAVASVRRRLWGVLVTAGVVAAVSWDALFTSTMYMLGIDIGGTSTGGDVAELAGAGAGEISLPPQVLAATHLFEAPGGTEALQPLLAGLAVAVFLFVAARLSGGGTGPRARVQVLMPVLPIAVMGAYAIAINIADAIVTGSAPHYGGQKLMFAVGIMALASCLPLAVALLEPRAHGMTLLRWSATGGVVALLVADTMLPRALSALSPQLWPGVDAASPAYWVPAEVKPQPEQEIASLPIACLFAPPQSEEPTALPLGQQAYSCTRLLVGLNGLEGNAGTLPSWLGTDWLSNQGNWAAYYGSLDLTTKDLLPRSVILMTPEYGVAGLTSWGDIMRRVPSGG